MSKQVTYNELSELTGRTYRTVKGRLEKAGLRPVRTEGRAMFFESPDALVAILAPKNQDEKLVLEDERAKLTIEQRRKAKRDNDIADGKVAPVELLTVVLSKVSGEIADSLNALTLSLKRKNPNLTARDLEFLKKELAACRNNAARTAVNGLESVIKQYQKER